MFRYSGFHTKAPQKTRVMDKSDLPQDGEVRHIDGRDRCFFGGYWIRYYPPIKKTDLQGALKLVNTFEWRFQKAVETGMEATPDDDRIEEQRKLFEAAKAQRASLTDKQSRAYKHAEEEERVFGGMLAVSLFRRTMENIKEHITLRLMEEKTEELQPLRTQIERDFMESAKLFDYVRRAGGKKDKDQVLKEMLGEPMFVFTMTLPEASPGLIDMFHNNRYRKIAASWKNIDNTTAAIKKLVATSPALKCSALTEMIDALAANAKARCELRRSDQPEYDRVAGHLRASRNEIRDFEIDGPHINHAASLTRKTDDKILDLVQDYRKLVYDIAHVRTPRNVSSAALIERINRAMGIGTSRIAG